MLTTALREFERRPGEYGDKVRVISRSGGGASCDLVVQTMASEGWKDLRAFNDFSDDYAHTNADKLARAMQRVGVL